MIRLWKWKAVLCMVMVCVNLAACGSKVNKDAYFQGEYWHIDGEVYVETAGWYVETNNVVCRTANRYTIYEVEGDVEHNYVVARSFLDQYLYVKENYIKDKTVIEGVWFGVGSSEKYIDEEAFLETFHKMLEYKDVVEMDDDRLMQYRMEGIDVHIKYENDCVGDYCGFILYGETGYMFYNSEGEYVTRLSKEIVEKLKKYNILEK